MTIYATARVAPEKADFRPALLSLPIAGLQPEKMMAKMTYAEQLRHPHWQKRRLERLEAAMWGCENCGEDKVTLHVHHKHYVKGRMAWEYTDEELSVLCEVCHEQHHINEKILREILLHIPIEDAVALLGGYQHGNQDIDPGLLEQCRQTYAPGYMLGFVAQLHGFCSMDYVYESAKSAVRKIKPGLEIHEVFSASEHIFGKG
jgi:hypothetical protein